MSDLSNPTDNFAALFEQSGGVQKRSGPSVKVGARVEAVIVQITRDAVFVDLDQKRQAYMDRAEILGPDGQPLPEQPRFNPEAAAVSGALPML